MTTQASLNLSSYNKKTGPIPVSTSDASTCPTSCPFKKHGCYAESGPLRIVWTRIGNENTKSRRAEYMNSSDHSWENFLSRVESIPDGQLWRHNQAGDLPGKGDHIDVPRLAELVKANAGKKGFTYTHKPLNVNGNRAAIKAANKKGFTINLSANNLAHADALAKAKVGPVVVALPHDQTTDTVTPGGIPVTVCRAVGNDYVNCQTCGLCQKKNRKSIVGFPAHGSGWKLADEIARG
jgi:hypothetical protein